MEGKLRGARAARTSPNPRTPAARRRFTRERRSKDDEGCDVHSNRLFIFSPKIRRRRRRRIFASDYSSVLLLCNSLPCAVSVSVSVFFSLACCCCCCFCWYLVRQVLPLNFIQIRGTHCKTLSVFSFSLFFCKKLFSLFF